MSDELEPIEDWDMFARVPRDTKLKPLNNTELEAINVIEHYWHLKGEFPKKGYVHMKSPTGFDLTEALEHPTFLLALSNRGITPPVLSSLPVGEKDVPELPANITAEQVAVVLSLVDYNDTRTRAAKMRTLKVSTAKFNSWMRDDNFRTFFNALSAQNFAEGAYIAREGLIKAMDRGEVAAIKYYNESQGEDPETRNLSLILTKLVEVIQMHVKDQATLHAIERDFRDTMAGRPVARPVIALEEL